MSRISFVPCCLPSPLSSSPVWVIEKQEAEADPLGQGGAGAHGLYHRMIQMCCIQPSAIGMQASLVHFSSFQTEKEPHLMDAINLALA